MALLYLNNTDLIKIQEKNKDIFVPSTPSSPIHHHHLINHQLNIVTVSDVASLIVHTLWYNIPLIALIHDTQHDNLIQDLKSKSHNYKAFNAHCNRFLILTGLSAQVVKAGLYYIYQLKKIVCLKKVSLKVINTDLLLWSTTLLIAHKYLDDKTYTNATFGRFNGIDGQLLNQCEVELLGLFDYGIGINSDLFEKFGESLRRMVGDAVDCLDVSRKLTSQKRLKRFNPYSKSFCP